MTVRGSMSSLTANNVNTRGTEVVESVQVVESTTERTVPKSRRAVS
jgi:hypothetical protein